MPLLLILFVASGCSALIYEIVWFQLLELVLGSSAFSLAVLLGTFMGGLCLGSLLFPRAVSRDRHPLRVYAAIELAIGLVGLAVLAGMPLVGGIYAAWAGSGLFNVALRASVAAVCLLPPTMLMGATFPAIARYVETTPRGMSLLGLFYGGNIAGAVIGCLLAGFYLLRLYDVATATFAAVAINGAVGVVSLALARLTSYAPAPEAGNDGAPARRAPAIYVVIAVSGMTALAGEVVWTRILSLLIGPTVYTFALVLAVFLSGLGIGSGIGSAIAASVARPRLALGWCQLLLCGAIAWTAYMAAASVPFWPVEATLFATPWLKMHLDLARAVWVLLPPAILWGASFPLALASLAGRGHDPARLAGGVYAANTVGAIVGALAASPLVAWLGSQLVQQILIGVSAAAALAAAASTSTPDARPARRRFDLLAGGAAALGCVILLAGSVPPVPERLVEYGRFAWSRGEENKLVYLGEGLTASVAASQLPDGRLLYHNAGKVQASSDRADMRLQRMLGHLATLVARDPRSVLVIGCGTGITAGAVSIAPATERVTVVDIEALVPRAIAPLFRAHNYDLAANPKVRFHVDDGRHFLLTTSETFDVITSDPFDPWVKGAAALYTREFFETVKRRLNPGGVVTQFVQLYESSEDVVKSQIATFFDVFPNGAVFANTVGGYGYDVVLLAQAEPTTIHLDEVERRLGRPEFATVAESLWEIGFESAVDLFSTFAGRASDLRPWFADATINRDRNLRLQYLAGLGLNLRQANPIYTKMIVHADGFPDDLFTGSEPLVRALRDAIDIARGE